MKKLFAAAALAGLFASTAVFAQDDHRDDHKPGPGGGAPPAHATQPQGHAMDQRQPHNPPANPGPAASGGAVNHTTAGPSMRGPGMAGPSMRGPGMAGPSMAGPNRPAAPNAARAAPHRNFSAYNRNFTAPRRFHAPVYHPPSGFYAHRWTYGERLPSAFWVRDYWLTDFFDFGLTPPPPGTVWVRYGNDALLIDEYDGSVIQVEYNAFY